MQPAPVSAPIAAIRTFDPRRLLGDRLGLTLYTLVARAFQRGEDSPAFAWYERFVRECGETREHDLAGFRRLFESVRAHGFDPALPIYANPREFALRNGAHRSAIAIALGHTSVPYHLRFQDDRTPDSLFEKVFSEAERSALRDAQEALIAECPPELALVCRVRRTMRAHEKSFSAAFSSKTRLPVLRAYQGWERLAILGKRSTEQRLAAYGLGEFVRRDMRTLEVGCNSAFLSLALADRVAHVTAFDADPVYIAIGLQVAAHLGVRNCTLFPETVETYRAPERYDCVISCAVHGWISLDFARYAAWLQEHMKPGALLLFESHELDCHPEWQDQKRLLLSRFELVRSGWIDDVDDDVYESELREFLVLRGR